MQKRGITLVLAGILFLLIAGCGQSGSPVGEEEKPPQYQQPDVLEEDEQQPSKEVPNTELVFYEDNFAVDAAAAATFAEKIQVVVAEKNLEGLADLASYPLYVGSASIESREELIALDAEKVFTEDLLTEITEADIDGLKPSKAGFSLSKSGYPNVVFGVVAGSLAIVGINY